MWMRSWRGRNRTVNDQESNRAALSKEEEEEEEKSCGVSDTI